MNAQWVKNQGRNGDGDKFLFWDYVDEDGRILATVECPTADSHEHKCVINIDGSPYSHCYTNATAAMIFCESAVKEFLPLEREAIEVHSAHLRESLRRKTVPLWKRLLRIG